MDIFEKIKLIDIEKIDNIELEKQLDSINFDIYNLNHNLIELKEHIQEQNKIILDLADRIIRLETKLNPNLDSPTIKSKEPSHNRMYTLIQTLINRLKTVELKLTNVGKIFT